MTLLKFAHLMVMLMAAECGVRVRRQLEVGSLLVRCYNHQHDGDILMMNIKYIASDHHFGHQRIIELANRPFESVEFRHWRRRARLLPVVS